MELNDALDFIRERQHGVLVTTKQDGRPQLSNISFALGDDGVIRVSVTDSRAKTANARRDPRVSLHVTRDDFYAYAVIEGQAELTPVATDPDDGTVDELVDYYRAIAGEHPDWDDYRRAMVADGRLVLRVRPERAYGMLPDPNG
jgi:PPOX class probable F420-dependent enzyme